MLKTSTGLQEQFAGLKRAMDTRITDPLGIPEPIQGADGKWQHLREAENGPRHNRLGLDIANLGTVYVLTGDAKYAEFAKKLLLAYADVYDKYAPGNRPGFAHDSGKCFDQRLSEATWLIQVARGYDLIYNLPSITPQEREHIQNDLIRAAAKFIAANRAVYSAPTNWSAISTCCAILIAGYATDEPSLVALARTGEGGSTRAGTLYGVELHFSAQAIDADGMWSEGAMGYQFMAMEALIADAEILWPHGVDMYRYRNGALKALFDSPLQFSYPDLTTPAIHDSGHGSIVGTESFMWEYGYLRYRDPKYRMILDQAGMHLEAQFQKFAVSVLYDRDLNAASEPAEWASVNLFGVGYGILRNTTSRGTISLLLDYGPNRSHGHPDKLNIDLWAFGDRLAADPGSIWYEKPLYRRWYHPTLSHNTLCVDELSQMPCGADQLAFGTADTMAIQRARTDGAYAGVIMDRAVFLTPDYVGDLFGAFASLPRKLDLSWHLRGDFSSELALKPFTLPEPREDGYNELTDVAAVTTAGPWSAAFKVEKGVARFVAAGGEETQVIVGDGYLGNERPKTILQRRQTAQTIYGNAIDLSGGAEPYVRGVTSTGSLKDGYGLLEVQTPVGTDLCFAAYRPGTYTLSGLETDAAQAFVLRDGDKVRSMYLADGTLLKSGGTILRRDKPGPAYLGKADNGAYILANPSPVDAKVEVRATALSGMQVYALDAEGKRTGTAGAVKDGAYSTVLAAKGRVELAAAGQASTFEHRQTMLREQTARQASELQRDKDACLARTAKRQAKAVAHPVPANTVVAVQAEAFAGQGGGEVRITDNKKAAIGKAFSTWDAEGHWLEYTVTVPAEGYYNLVLCYCSELAMCERSILVNGEAQEPFAPIVLPATGGWANGSDDWKLFTAENPVTNEPLLIKLVAGKNVIRLTNTNNRGANTDYVAVVSPDVKPTREILAAKLAQP